MDQTQTGASSSSSEPQHPLLQSPSPAQNRPAPPAGYREIIEGSAAVLFPATIQKDVFYNRAQVVNRDLSILVLRLFGQLLQVDLGKRKLKPRKMNILEALGASGLRSVRYRKEISSELVARIVCNDYSRDAVAAIRRNLSHNGVPETESGVAETDGDDPQGVLPSCDDAVALLYRYRNGTGKRAFNVIDLDPYGTAVPFLDAAIQAIDDGGLLLVTCTDAAVLCGTYPETCHAKYGAVTVKAKYCHEMALRVLLGHIEKVCNKYGRYITPLLSCSIDFYVRVFVRVFTSKNEVKFSLERMGSIYQCCECSAFHLAPVGKAHPSGSASRSKRAKRRREREAEAKGPNAEGAQKVPDDVIDGEAEDAEMDEQGQEGGEEERQESGEGAAKDHSDTPSLSWMREAVAAMTVNENDWSMQTLAKMVGPKNSNADGLRFSTTTFSGPSRCEVCNATYWVGGPLYIAPIHNQLFIRHLLKHLNDHSTEFAACDRIRGILLVAQTELPTIPFFFHLPTLASNLRMLTPPIAHIRSALRKLGYLVSQSHCDPDAIKTNAPNSVMYDVMRCYYQTLNVTTPPSSELAKRLLAVAPSVQVDFSAVLPDSSLCSKTMGVPLFPVNEPFWGPGSRAKCNTAESFAADNKGDEEMNEEQNKRKKT